MEEILKIEHLCKDYPKFSLKDVSFSINPGEIMGFIGRNGAGKTTTLKSIMNLVHIKSGKISAFGNDMNDFELENKQRIGFMLSEIHYYPNRTIRQLVDVTSKFYKDFDMEKFNKLADFFKLDVNKKIEALSSGMKVKYSLAIALSHNAELLILDEPTSGLDPISRDEILDIFRDIVKDGKRAILFSTHITSDLDKCASNITYIHDGEIQFFGKKNDFISKYFFAKGKTEDAKVLESFIYKKEIDGAIEGLINAEDKNKLSDAGFEVRVPDLEEIMIYLERSKDHESFTL